MKLAGASADARGEGLGRLPASATTSRAKTPRSGAELPALRARAFDGVYAALTSSYYGRGPQIEYDFRVAQARPASHLDGVRGRAPPTSRRARRPPAPDAAGEVRLLKPVAYQETETGSRVEVAARFVVRGNRVGFRLGTRLDALYGH